MNILYHHRTQGKGVEAVHITGIVDGLRGLGHHVMLIGPPGTNPEMPSHIISEENNSKRTAAWAILSKHFPEILFELLEIIYSLYAFITLNSILKAKSIDIIYERYSLFQFGGVLAAGAKNIPIILEVNDSAKVERVRTLKSRRLAFWFEKRILKKADALITISNYFKNQILSYGIDDNKVNVISNAINPDLFNPKRFNRQDIRKKYELDKKFIIGFVGLFVPWHGIMLLLDVFAELFEKNSKIHLLLVGDGPERPKVESRIAELKINNRVTITGYTQHDKIPDYIDCFDVAVMPNSNNYGSPVKIFEYMGMSKAIIAPAYPPILEVLKDARNALLFEPNNPQDFYSAIENLIKNKELLREIGDNAKREVMAKHTWEKNALKVVKIAHQIRQKPSSFLE